MLSGGFASALVPVVILALWFVLGVFVYVALIFQMRARPVGQPVEPVAAKTFGLPEAIVAVLLIAFLVVNVMASISVPSTALSTRDLAANLLLVVVVVLILLGFLQLRGFDLDASAGLSKLGIVRAVSTGALLLLAAYPLISAADGITRHFLGGASSKQSIVELFDGSQTIEQRILIIVLAVAIAPIAEEFVFRFFLYGVLKRYLGRFGGLAINALLFAAVHAHLPSFAPLLVLGACFTLAYEWSGSILVSMTMHSLFNSLSLIFLAFPELFPQ
jgi:membrane protease YdiL (CAAX protease family)